MLRVCNNVAGAGPRERILSRPFKLINGVNKDFLLDFCLKFVVLKFGFPGISRCVVVLVVLVVVFAAFFLVLAVVAVPLLLLPTGKPAKPPPGPPRTKK